MKQESTQTEEHPLRNAAAAVTGAAQGLKEGLQEEHLIEETKRAIHNVGELTRAAAGETRHQWESPEIRRLRRDTAQATEGTGGRMRDATVEAAARAGVQAQEVADRTRSTAHRVQERTVEAAHRAQDRIQHGVETTTHLVDEGRTRARAVGETSRRARRAPAHIKTDLKEATQEYKESLTSGLGMFAGAGLLGAAALVVLTVGMVVWLNGVFGAPAGYFVTVLVYAVVAGILAAVGKTARKGHRAAAREHVDDARKEVRHVTRPVRRAFSSDNR